MVFQISQEAATWLVEGEFEENKVETAWSDLQDECGLGHTANMKQCLKVAISRYMTHPNINNLSIHEENGVSNYLVSVFLNFPMSLANP